MLMSNAVMRVISGVKHWWPLACRTPKMLMETAEDLLRWGAVCEVRITRLQSWEIQLHSVQCSQMHLAMLIEKVNFTIIFPRTREVSSRAGGEN